MKKASILFIILILVSCNKHQQVNDDFVLLTGDVTSSSAILQCRFAASDTLINYDMPGISCKGHFVISRDSLFGDPEKTMPVLADEVSDYIIRETVTDLQPGTKYFFRAVAELPEGDVVYSRTGTFRTFPPSEASADISFAIATGFNYEHFYGMDTSRNRKYSDEPRLLCATGKDSVLGFEAFGTVSDLKPDFFIANGDVVYYDKPSSDPNMWARTPDELRAKWHRYFTMPRNREMCLNVPVFYLKDDHDHRFNDCDTTNVRFSEPSSQLGIEMFSEQVPVVGSEDPSAKTYRTVRMGKDLQLWFVEGRDYRSPNSMPDTPEKTIWGKAQKDWLMKTLSESDATFKILISPTPMIGPDDAYKKDNHTNPGGFQSERDLFFSFLAEEELIGNGFYIICGDRHWQYHSIAPNGLEEFSCGAFIDQNSRSGRLPGDPASTDPNAELVVPYVQLDDWGGGFLQVNLNTKGEQPVLFFDFKDIYGDLRYRVQKSL